MNLPDGWRRVILQGGYVVHFAAPDATTTACERYGLLRARETTATGGCPGCGRAALAAIKVADAVADGRLNPAHLAGPDLASVTDLAAYRRAQRRTAAVARRGT